MKGRSGGSARAYRAARPPLRFFPNSSSDRAYPFRTWLAPRSFFSGRHRPLPAKILFSSPLHPIRLFPVPGSHFFVPFGCALRAVLPRRLHSVAPPSCRRHLDMEWSVANRRVRPLIRAFSKTATGASTRFARWKGRFAPPFLFSAPPNPALRSPTAAPLSILVSPYSTDSAARTNRKAKGPNSLFLMNRTPHNPTINGYQNVNNSVDNVLITSIYQKCTHRFVDNLWTYPQVIHINSYSFHLTSNLCSYTLYLWFRCFETHLSTHSSPLRLLTYL